MKTPLLPRFLASSFLILAATAFGLSRASAVPGTNTADLSITKTTSSSNLFVGSNVIFTLTLQNFGPNPVNSAITVTDCLPTGLTYVTDSTVGNTNNGTYSPGTCWWTLPGGMAVGGSASITITAEASTAGTYTNTASVGAPAGYFDLNTNNNNSSVTLTLVSNAPPLSIDCSTNITVTATGTNGAVVFFSVSASGGCSTPFVGTIPASGSMFPVGTTMVTATATDTCAHSTNCSFTVTVVRPPISIDCSTNITVTATSSNGAAVFFTVTASGGCSTPFVGTIPASGSIFPLGTTMVTATASDNCGTSTNCSFTVTVTRPPISIDCSTNITVTTTSSNGAVVFFTVTASGGCSPPPFVGTIPASGSTFPIGTTMVTATASDNCGTSTNCSFTVTVLKSNCVLSVQCPSNITVTNNGPTNVFFAVTASDSCGGVPTINSMPPSGSSFPVGMTTVTSTASDANGSTNCSFTVTVIKPTCILSIECPPNITVTNPGPTAVFFAVAASDSCGGAPTVNSMPASGSTFPLGTTTVTSTATDINGSTNCSFTVTVTNAITNADLMVTKTASTNTVRVGQQLVFTVLLTNLGPSYISNTIVVTDCIPAGFEYITDNTYGTNVNGSYSPGTCWWTWSSGLGVGAIAKLQITVQAITNGVFTNTATAGVPAGITDTNLANNSSSAVVTNILPLADLMVLKSASTNTLRLGQQVVFTIVLTNLGPDLVTNSITVTDCLPAGFTYVTDNTYGTNVNGSYSPGTCWWTWSSGLATNTVAQLQITAQATATNVYTNIATVGVPPEITDPNLNNNVSTAVVTILPPKADLQIMKTIGSTNVQVGQPVTYTLTLQNLGPDSITNQVVVTDCLSPGVQYVTDSTVGNAGNGVYSAGTCLWTIPNGIATNSPLTLTITVLPATNVCITNTASVAVPAGVTDPNPGNNTASVQSCINPRRTLSGSIRNCQTNGTPLPAVTVALTGPTNLVTTTTANGSYSFTNLPDGNYTVIPSQPGNSFMPPVANVMVNGNTTVPTFTGATPLIYGQVTYGTNGPGLGGITVALSGGGLARPRIEITDTNGNYVFTNTGPAAYTLTPTPTNGFVFQPTNIAITLTATNCSARVVFVAAPRNVQLIAMEVTQVIQDWNNSVPLVAAKSTYVRAHLQLPPTNSGPVLMQGARLIGAGPGGSLGALSPVNTNGSLLVQTTNAANPFVRMIWTNSLDFQIPAAWCLGNISLQLVWTNNGTLTFQAPPNGGGNNGVVAANFIPSVIPNIKIYGFNWTNGGIYQTINLPAYNDLPGRFTTIYPVPDATQGNLARLATPPAKLSVPARIPNFLTNKAYTVDGIGDLALVYANAKLIQFQANDLATSKKFGGSTNWIYFSALAAPTPGTYGWAGAFVTTNNTFKADGTYVSSGFVYANFYGEVRQTPPHEVGHNLGLPHPDQDSGNYPLFQPISTLGNAQRPALGPMTTGTNTLIFGLDTLTLRTGYVSNNINPIASPYYYFDLMSYDRDFVDGAPPASAPLERWVSSYTYAFINSNLNKFYGSPPVAPPPGPAKDWIYVRGLVDFSNDTGALFPMWTLNTTNIPPGPPAGDYYVVAYGSSNQVLQQIPFDVQEFQIEQGDANENTAGLFLVPVPADVPISQIQVWDGLNNVLLASAVPSTNLPSVSSLTLTDTNGQTFPGTGMLDVSWQGLDADPNAQLTYTVQYSPDGGATWDTLDVDATDTSYQIDSQYLDAATQAVIRVFANDGFNSSTPVASSSFVIPTHPPSVSILQPQNGQIYALDEQIFLQASAVDPQDGVLDGASVQWTSSLNGSLGAGDQLNYEADTLTEGSHTITVTATDSASLSASASVQIFVLSVPPPQLGIQFNGQDLLLTWPTSFTNYTLQSTGRLTVGAWSSVTNAPAQQDSIQTITLPLSPTNLFFRLQRQ